MTRQSTRIGIALFIALMVSPALAQLDTGVEVETDEFTGAVSCQQTIFRSYTDPTGLGFQRADGMTFVYILRGEAEFDPAFNMFGVTDGDLIYFRWPDGTVDEYEPVEVSFESDPGLEFAALVDHQLAVKLMAAPGDVRVRFSGPNRNADFTIEHSTITALAQGFGQECLD